MGALFEGRWVDTLPPNAKPTGPFRSTITADGRSGYNAEAGRYHLYVSPACPFANRAMIARALKKLDHAITMTLASPKRNEQQGWEFVAGPGSTEDSVNGARFVHEVYSIARPDYTGPASVPALFDRKTKTIVNNESLDILRMFGGPELNAIGDPSVDLYPPPLRAEIDKTLSELGFLLPAPFKFKSPEGPQVAQKVKEAFAALDAKLAKQRYLAGAQLTEADVAFYPPLVRYAVLFAESARAVGIPPVSSFPNLHGWLRELAAMPAFQVVDLELIQRAAGVNDAGEALAALRSPHGRG